MLRQKNLVQAEEDMDDETFTRHMNARHKESLGSLKYLWYHNEYAHRNWRKFHWRLHELRVDLEHEHDS